MLTWWLNIVTMFLATRDGTLECALVAPGDGTVRKLPDLEPAFRRFEEEVSLWRRHLNAALTISDQP